MTSEEAQVVIRKHTGYDEVIIWAKTHGHATNEVDLYWDWENTCCCSDPFNLTAADCLELAEAFRVIGELLEVEK